MLNIEGTALDVARAAFGWLTAPPHPVGFDGSVVGRPGAWVALDELRELLLDRRCPHAVRDAAWRELVARSRRPGDEGAVWTLGAIGIALPALVSAAASCCATADGLGRIERSEVDSAVLIGFVAGLARVDLDRPAIMGRLRWAALRAGQDAVNCELCAPAPVGSNGDLDRAASSSWRSTSGATTGDASAALLAAVAAGVLTATESQLISRTRLDGESVAEVGQRLGLPSYAAARLCRSRAERRLLAHLTTRRPASDSGGAAGGMRPCA